MARTRRSGGMTVHRIDSPEGGAALAKRGITLHDLATAISRFQKAEGVRVGTLIGVNEHGVFGSTRDGWQPDLPDGFAEPLLTIPWVQILELLGRVPDGTTGVFLDDPAKPISN